MVIKIAEIPVEVLSSSISFLKDVKERYSKFITTDSGEYKVKVIIRNTRRLKLPPKVIKTDYGYDIFYNNINAKFKVKEKEIIATLPENQFLFNSLLRILFSLILAKKDGFLLHSCGIKNGKYGYIFFGKMSAGKTTIARLSKNFDVLSDEIVIIRKYKNNFMCFGTPFCGSGGFEKNNVAKCYKMFYLIKDRRNFLIKVKSGEALKKILSCVVFFSDDIILQRNIFMTVKNLLNKINVFDMHFTKNINIKKFLEVKSERRQG